MKSMSLLRLLAPLAIGIGVGHFLLPWLLPYLHLLVVACSILLVLSAVALWRHIAGSMLTSLSMSLLFCIGITLFVYQQRAKQAPIASPTSLTFRGIITEVPHRTTRGWRVTLRMLSPRVGELWQVYLTDSTAAAATAQSNRENRNHLPQIGQEILAHGRATALLAEEGRTKDEYSAYLLRQNIVVRAHCFQNDWKIMGQSPTHDAKHQRITAVQTSSLTFHERLLRQREQWISVYQNQLPPHTAAILSAMTLAHREMLDRDTQMRYNQGGASHILALSGLHLSILFGAFTLIIGSAARCFGRKIHLAATLFGILLIWFFAAFVGFPTSLVRATLMLTLAHLFSWGNHRPGALHGLLLSMILMLIYAPDWLFDVGFQLSCAAVAGILIFSPLFPTPSWLEPMSKRAAELANRRPTSPFVRGAMSIGRFFYALFTVSFSAQLATAPLVAYHFHQVPWAGAISSLFVIPIAYVLLIGSAFFLLISPLRALLSPMLVCSIDMLERGLTLFSQKAFAPLALYPSALTAILSLLALFALSRILLRTKSASSTVVVPSPSLVRTTSFATLCLLLPLLSYQVDRYRARPQASLLLYPTSGVTTLHIIAPDGHSWLLASDTLRAKSALRQVAHDDWPPQGLSVQWASLSVLENPATFLSTTSPSLRPFLAPHCVIFGRRRIAVVDSRLSRAFPQQPLSVDVLLVGHDVHRPLAHLLCYYRPKQLVLSAAMTDFYRHQYTIDAAKLHLSCYDLSQQSTFQLRP